MPQFIITWLITAIALLITAQIVPGLTINSISASIIGAAFFGIVNAIVKPILILLTLPLTIFSLGLFLLAINAICFGLVGYLTAGFAVNGFFPALFGSIVLSLVSSLIHWLFFNNSAEE